MSRYTQEGVFATIKDPLCRTYNNIPCGNSENFFWTMHGMPLGIAQHALGYRAACPWVSRSTL